MAERVHKPRAMTISERRDRDADVVRQWDAVEEKEGLLTKISTNMGLSSAWVLKILQDAGRKPPPRKGVGAGRLKVGEAGDKELLPDPAGEVIRIANQFLLRSGRIDVFKGHEKIQQRCDRGFRQLIGANGKPKVESMTMDQYRVYDVALRHLDYMLRGMDSYVRFIQIIRESGGDAEYTEKVLLIVQEIINEEFGEDAKKRIAEKLQELEANSQKHDQ